MAAAAQSARGPGAGRQTVRCSRVVCARGAPGGSLVFYLPVRSGSKACDAPQRSGQSGDATAPVVNIAGPESIGGPADAMGLTTSRKSASNRTAVVPLGSTLRGARRRPRPVEALLG